MAKTDSINLAQLVEALRQAHGDNLASIVLYGSAAAGDHVELRSDQNLLVALNRITAEDLQVANAAMVKWQSGGQHVPVYFTTAELQDAADVFPIEFLQMERARKVLFGRDPFEFVEISRANLRHQTEYELRTKFLRLRRLYIPASASTEKLSALMTDSLVSFAALFRAVLILLGAEPPVGKRDAVRATVNLLKLDAAPFDRIFELRAGKGRTLKDEEGTELFSKYMEQIESVIEAVDRVRTGSEATGS